jgi:hypothetical protein
VIAANPRIVLALFLSGGLLDALETPSAFAKDSTRSRLEEMARNCSHFSLTVIVRNQDLRLWPPGSNVLVLEQQRLVKDLLELKDSQKTLERLLEHTDPKVRTLALGALFLRQDGRDLPLIGRVLGEAALTFPDLHNSPHSAGGPRPITEVEQPQSVGDVAQAMLGFWGVPVTGQQVDRNGHIEKRFVTSKDFQQYWKKYAGRQYSASWFEVKMKRATGQTIPILSTRKPAIQRVLAQLNSIPMPDRAWIQLYVLAPDVWFELEPEDLVITDDELISMIKPLGPDALLRFLQRQKISDDPALFMDKQNGQFVRMSNFILRHADNLMAAKDADALLACEYVLRDSDSINPSWAIGAALVQPSRASQILRLALARKTQSLESDAGRLAGALWRIRGPSEMDFLVHWFYETLPTSTPNMPGNEPVAFLWEVEAAKRPDTKQLIAALVKDSRFDSTDWDTLVELLKIVNTGRSTPLVSERDIYQAQPNGSQDDRMVFSVWRNQLRREYGLPEEPLPLSTATAKQVLRQPAWSVLLAGAPSWAASDSAGHRLAILTNGTITIWNAGTGEFWWQIPRGPTEAAFCMAFESGGQRLMVFDRAEGGRFKEWNIAARQGVGRVLLTGKPQSGVDQGAYEFDRAARCAIFSGYNELACFDTRSGQPLWLHSGEGGVGSHVTLSEDGTRLAATRGVGSPRVVRLYDATSGKILQSFDRFASPVLALTLSSDGRKLVTASGAGGVQLWDAATGNLLRAYACRVPNWGASAVVLSFDDQWLAVEVASPRYGEATIGIFRVSSGDLEWEIPTKPGDSFGPGIPLAFSPDGKILYTGNKRLEAWSLN